MAWFFVTKAVVTKADGEKKSDAICGPFRDEISAQEKFDRYLKSKSDAGLEAKVLYLPTSNIAIAAQLLRAQGELAKRTNQPFEGMPMSEEDEEVFGRFQKQYKIRSRFRKQHPIRSKRVAKAPPKHKPIRRAFDFRDD